MKFGYCFYDDIEVAKKVDGTNWKEYTINACEVEDDSEQSLFESLSDTIYEEGINIDDDTLRLLCEETELQELFKYCEFIGCSYEDTGYNACINVDVDFDIQSFITDHSEE